jgi:CBS domain-containing protein
LTSHQTRREAADMVASDLMTETVTSVAAAASVRDVALLLLDSHIGAVPVLDESGTPVGMVSDGDLLGRRVDDERKDWWLDLLAHDAQPSALSPASRTRLVRDIMTTPLISVSPYTPVREVVRLLQSHRIKRLPVVLEGKLAGIISRADLLNLVAHLPKTAAEEDGASGGLYGMLQSLTGGIHHATAADAPPAKLAATPAAGLSAEDFRNLVTASDQAKIDEAAEVKRVACLERDKQIEAVLEQHVTNESWQELLDHAELAAKNGEKQLLLLRFPAGVCSDGGRAIANVEEGWEKTLRGEAAEIYARWDRDLKPKGFGLDAPTLSFAHDTIGDVGLVLTWAA